MKKAEKDNARKIKKKEVFIYLAILLIISLCFFSASYFFNYSIDSLFFLMPYPYLIVSLIFWVLQPIANWKKPFVIIGTAVISIIFGYLLVLSTMYLPGSKNRAYVESEICSPAVMKHYGVKNITDLPSSHPAHELGQNGYRWYAQIVECMNNFYKGKGRVFSENPPGFLPVVPSAAPTKSQTPTSDAEHSGVGVIEFANVEEGSGVQIVRVKGVGSFAVIPQTKIYDENNKQVAFSYLREGQNVRISGTPGEGNLIALEIRVQN
jgi:hypothetical protein